MIMNPKVSIVLPCYNGASMLPQAIESVLSQTFQDWELIIVNDCSTDNTLEIAMRYEENDERIRVFSNSVNKKLPASLNEGFSHARGEYFTWTSDDNILLPNMLEMLCSFLDKHEDIGLVVSDYDIIDVNGNYVRTIKIPNDINICMPLNNYVGASFMYRRSIAQITGRYDERLYLVEDYDYWIRLWKESEVGIDHHVLYKYRIHNNSLTSKRKKEIAENLLKLRLRYICDVEDRLRDYPEKIALLYYRIVDNAKFPENIGYYIKFIFKNPYYFGFKYTFIHLPNLFLKNYKMCKSSY